MKAKTGTQLCIYTALLFSYVASSALACESGRWVKSVQDDGKIVILEDGSVWEIDDGDTADTAAWLPKTEIVICDDKLINTDDDETGDAKKDSLAMNRFTIAVAPVLLARFRPIADTFGNCWQSAPALRRPDRNGGQLLLTHKLAA